MSENFVSMPIDTRNMGNSVAGWVIRVGEPKPDNWESFLVAANEWFVSYALPPYSLSAVKLFSIGHTVELYLKAAATKLSGDLNKATGYSHNLKELWNYCKSQDASFMPMYEIRKSVFDAPIHDAAETQKTLSQADFEHFLAHQEFYVVCKILPDLKYLGAPLKKVRGDYAFSFVHPSPYWLNFIRDIRIYLGETTNTLDVVRIYLDPATTPLDGHIPEQTKTYLQGLYTSDVSN